MLHSSMGLGDQVEQTVEAAARRRMKMEAAEQFGWAAIFLFAGLMVLMLAGSLIFRWQWLLFLLLAGAALGTYRLRKSLLPRYAVAQMLDRRLHLSDTLSTAYYLRSNSGFALPGSVRYQLEQADRLAATVQPEQSFPFTGHRIWTAAGALAAASLGLFAVRYMVTESLSLRPALVSLQIAPIVEKIHEVLAPKKTKSGRDALPNRPGTKAEEANGKEAQNGRSPEAEATPPPSVGTASADGSPSTQQATSEAAKAGNDGQSQGKPGDAALAKQDTPKEPGTSATPQPPDAGNRTAGSPQQSNSPQAQTKEQRPGSTNTSPGVMGRMKDALSSMMAKMQAASNPQQSKSGQQSSSDPKNGEQAQASGQPKQGNQSQQQQSQNQASNPSESADGQAQGQTAEKQGTTQGKSSDQSAQNGSDAHSGVGQQDGDKDIKNAEQLKAMGKLAEIIGKRSANLTGDMTVETSSGKQQLKTDYSHRVGQHSDSGGEINRNQVPLAYQPYVREYMEQVRKQDKGSQ